MLVVVHGLSALAMVVVTPMALRLLTAPGLAVLRRGWPWAAIPGAVALFLPRGAGAAALAATYAALTLALAATAAARAVRGCRTPVDVAALTALVAPVAAGVALVAERTGHELFGFSLPVLALTVPHLHYAGLAAVLVAGLTARATGPPTAALAVPTGVALVLVGFFAGEWVELAGAALLTAGLWLAAWRTWRTVRPRATDRAVRVLLAVSSGILVVTMLLALAWAGGRALDLPHPSVAWMVATHGVLNALGFAVCAILAWRRLEASPL